MTVEFIATSAVTLFVAVLGSGLINALISRKFAKEDKRDLEREALKYLMRDSLTRYLKELIADGEASDADKQYAADWHVLYEKFGWNGQLDSLMDKVRDLPEEKEESA